LNESSEAEGWIRGLEMQIKRAFLILAFVTVAIIALLYGISPAWFAGAFLGVNDLSVNAFHILRAVMCLYLALGCFWLFSAHKRQDPQIDLCRSLADGRSHLMNFKMNGKEQSRIGGEELKLDKPGTVKVTADVAAYLPVEPETVQILGVPGPINSQGTTYVPLPESKTIKIRDIPILGVSWRNIDCAASPAPAMSSSSPLSCRTSR
jgi:hypothetical protein